MTRTGDTGRPGDANEGREWSIQQIAALAGTTSRTLRHYGDLGLLQPIRIGANGYRYYDGAALVRLQRILLLRQLGLGLGAIRDVLQHETAAEPALATHLDWLQRERERLDRQIVSVQTTLDSIQKGRPLMADTMFDGFDHTQYKDEVHQRWGAAAYARSDRWWRSMTDAERNDFTGEGEAIAAAYGELGAAVADASGADTQSVVRRHVVWLGAAMGGESAITAGYLTGLGELYVSDARFGEHFDRHGAGTAAFVRDALNAYAVTLPD